MLRDILSGAFGKDDIIQMLLLIPIIMISISVHECAHGYAAHKLGDDTARNLGRITLNPLKHLDPLGFLMLLFFGFGYAKPVPVNTRYMKNAKWGFVITSLAGPLSNILMAFVACILGNLAVVIGTYVGLSTPMLITIVFFRLALTLNVGYAVFNLLPIPPLDGSRLLTACLPRAWALWTFRYERYFSFAILALLYFGAFTNIISTCVSALVGLIDTAVGFIPFELLYKI